MSPLSNGNKNYNILNSNNHISRSLRIKSRKSLSLFLTTEILIPVRIDEKRVT